MLAVIVFHSIAGKWSPARLPAATASVETVSPPDLPFYHVVRIYGRGCLARALRFAGPKRTLWMLGLRLLSDVAGFGQHLAVGAVAIWGYGVNP